MPSRRVHLALIPLTVVLASAVCGCTSRHTPTSAFPSGLTLAATFSPTPSAALYIAREDGISSGNGVWIGDSVLTARHVLASSDGALPDRVQIDDQLAPIDVIAAGNAEALRDRREESVLLRRQEDWIVASVGGRAARVMPAVLPGDGTVRPGERLYMVGYDIRGGHGEVRAVELRVPRRVESDVVVPERVTVAMLPRVDDWRGWSGSFVGRYAAASEIATESGGSLNGGRWEFVGIASSVMMDGAGRTQLMTIVRPPEEVVRAFFDRGTQDVPVLVGLPGPLALPPGYHATSSVPLVLTDSGDTFVINLCVAQRDAGIDAPNDATSDARSGRTLVSIHGCDPRVGWVAVEPVEEAEPEENALADVPR